MRSTLLALALLLFVIHQDNATDNRIVGGRPAEEGEFPYQVSLRRSYNDKHFCGGTLITPSHVLTAAHCMYYQWGGILPPVVISVVAGQLHVAMRADTIYRNASRIRIHPQYNKTSMENDVAIVALAGAMPLDHYVATIRLAADDDGQRLCVVSGWGVQQFASLNISDTLLTTTVTRIDSALCDRMYGNNTIHASMMCAHDDAGAHDACQGDSGGPLVCAGRLVGVISTGEGCASALYPGIYASVPYLHEWIVETVRTMNDTMVATTEAGGVEETTNVTNERPNITTIITPKDFDVDEEADKPNFNSHGQILVNCPTIMTIMIMSLCFNIYFVRIH